MTKKSFDSNELPIFFQKKIRNLYIGLFISTSLIITSSILAERTRSLIGELEMSTLHYALSLSNKGKNLKPHISYEKFRPDSWLAINNRGVVTHSNFPQLVELPITDDSFNTFQYNSKIFTHLKYCIHKGVKCDLFTRPTSSFNKSNLTFVHPVNSDVPMEDSNLVLMTVFRTNSFWQYLFQQFPQSLGTGILLSLVICIAPYLYTTRVLSPAFYYALQIDQLTGLMNRNLFTRVANTRLAEYDAGQQLATIAIIDIDNFKQINDTYGHAGGDLALKQLGQIIMSVMRNDQDISCRLGGEEFSLVISCKKADSFSILERLRLQVQLNVIHFEGSSFQYTISIGATSTQDSGYSLEYLLHAADSALYYSKKTGKNKVAFYKEDML
ncbi:MAG: GGDEF domain-containing protein [Synechococcus sp. WH 8007]|nr:GGDEF domain-containing protein [Synechococcus sp. WH 8007]